ncbi:hypothetical protein QBC47DRAFT_395892 [Echria macrotheca]|uniref:Mitochondrial distribution and morphology protein 10 n=1 Tax=Echria macrotheca TaxID=438768 RepID=A0AAJ0B4R3_9PEZI|nr:hypothetical protein QBC47DRAFT_395892 [Echria macrotheca]
MREFMHYITNAFYSASDWNEDNTYKELNATARELIDFPLPLGLRLSLSSLATPHFATSYHLGSVGIVDGSISYLYTSVPLRGVAARSDRIPLPALLRSYRELHDIGPRLADTRGGPGLFPLHLPSWLGRSTAAAPSLVNTAPAGDRGGKNKSQLLYGRLYLPQSLLEGLVIKRFSRSLQVQLSAVSQQSLRNGGTLLGLVQYDKGKYGIEGLASSDGGLLGIRGLYNFGGDASPLASAANPQSAAGGESSGGSSTGQTGERERERIYGRFSAGGELYYGTLNKSGGMSLGARFATLPTHRGTPLTATLTINPLMGNINATYAVLAKDYCSLATRMEFNVYSYESEWAVGMELWSNRRPAGFLLGALPNPETEIVATRPRIKERSFQAKMEWRLDDPEPEPEAGAEARPSEGKEKYLGVFKARLDQNLRIGLLWEGRIKSLIFSLGSGVDLHRLDEPFRSLGLDVQYSS